MRATDALLFSTPATYSALSREAKRGRARRVGPGVYTRDLTTPASHLVRAHWRSVLEHFCPGAVISDRSAVRGAPDEDGVLFVVHGRDRPLVLPGLTVVPRPGVGALAGDVPLGVGPDVVWLSSKERALVENLRRARAVAGRPSRTLSERELQGWIAQLLRAEGPDRLNALRDRARERAAELELSAEFPRLDALIGAALGTREVALVSPALSAAARGRVFDERRDPAFAALREALDGRGPAPRPVLPSDERRLRMLPFFEAYFSNFIEGTEFSVEEAAEIALRGAIPKERPADAHDIRGTYSVVADSQEMRRSVRSIGDLLELLRSRHLRIMEGRPEKRPGEFKLRQNRAGSTDFVAPDHVVGTLERGLTFFFGLTDPFARAVFMLFLVSEVHPFEDGNGRVARVMMNAELATAEEHRIIIPTVYRNEYLSSLRALTHHSRPDPLIRVLDFAQRYTAQLDCSSLEQGKAILAATHAFMDSNEAADQGVRLTLPSTLER